MSWSFKKINVDEHGKIVAQSDMINILGGFSIAQMLGDESFIQSGEVSFEHRFILNPASGGGNYCFLLFYFGGNLIDAFEVEQNYSEMDLRQPYKYQSRLKSLQRKFYTNLGERGVGYSAEANSWNYNLPNAEVLIEKIKVKYGEGSYGSALERAGYSLGDLIISLQKGVDGYYVDNVGFFDCQKKDGINLPILYRGESLDTEESDSDKLYWTFEQFGMTWLDLIKLAIFGWNSFVVMTPKVLDVSGDDYLAIDVDILPKDVCASYSATTPQWLNCRVIPQKYYLDGIHLISSITDTDGVPSFDYQQGALTSNNILEREIAIADPDAAISIYNDTLYWSAGDYDTGKYDILDGSENNRPYFKSGLVDPYYAGMITSGNGYTGKIRYAGERVGDTLNTPDSHVIQINKLTIKRDKGGAVADVEGLVIA